MDSKHHPLLEALLLLFAKLVFLPTICAFIGDHLLVYLGTYSKIRTHNASAGDGLKVIACGLSRSGTLSLKFALDHLGFRCYHGIHLLDPQHSKLWLKATPRQSFTRDDLEPILHGYTAIADFPAGCFYKELMVTFPDAKVILNTRDPEQWYQSCLRTVWSFQRKILLRMFRPAFWRFAETAFFAGKFEGRFEEREFAIGVYERHIEEAQRHVPKEKLLLYQNKDGWAPLCDFLKVRIPDDTFPSVNDTQSMKRFINRTERALGVLLAAYIGLLSCIGAFLFKHLLSF